VRENWISDDAVERQRCDLRPGGASDSSPARSAPRKVGDRLAPRRDAWSSHAHSFSPCCRLSRVHALFLQLAHPRRHTLFQFVIPTWPKGRGGICCLPSTW